MNRLEAMLPPYYCASDSTLKLSQRIILLINSTTYIIGAGLNTCEKTGGNSSHFEGLIFEVISVSGPYSKIVIVSIWQKLFLKDICMYYNLNCVI